MSTHMNRDQLQELEDLKSGKAARREQGRFFIAAACKVLVNASYKQVLLGSVSPFAVARGTRA